jgi:hypothetical protein
MYETRSEMESNERDDCRSLCKDVLLELGQVEQNYLSGPELSCKRN